jgi:hypothetical protein
MGAAESAWIERIQEPLARMYETGASVETAEQSCMAIRMAARLVWMPSYAV